MTVYFLYRRGQQEVRELERLAGELEREHIEAQLIDADTPRGISLAESYDVLARPAALLVRSDGQLVQLWTETMPTRAELVYGARG